MDALLYASIAWSVVGFVLGWVTCRAAVKVAEADAKRKRAGDMSKTSRMDVVRAALGILILLLLLVSGYGYYKTTSCQTEYNRAVAEALFQRADAQRQESEAQIELLTATLSGNREAARRETNEYIAALHELERARSENPLPSPPDCRRFR